MEMARSMTGFGRGEFALEGKRFTVEIKTVNHRYFEPNIRISRKISSLEPSVRDMLKRWISRGKVDVYINYEDDGALTGSVLVNEALLGEYVEALRKAGSPLGLADDLSLSHILSFPEVLKAHAVIEDEAYIESLLMQALTEALNNLTAMREKEGGAIRRDLLDKLDAMSQLVEEIKQRAPMVVRNYRDKLRARVEELLDEAKLPSLDPGRLETEVTLFADRCCIDEELTRLSSHIQQFRQALDLKEASGRKLDFLTQELNREANTIASKSNDLEITRAALGMKNEIEKIREQIQNLE